MAEHSHQSSTFESVIEAARCPRCTTALDLGALIIACAGCGQVYPRIGRIPILISDPHTYLASCRQQLSLLEQQVAATVRTIEEQLNTPDALPATKARCHAMIDAVRGQAADICGILQPLLPVDTTDLQDEIASEDLPAPLKYIHHLYRDWGWPSEPNGENERALAAVEGVMETQTLGRTLVVGAGACRLAYDLHRSDPEAETVVMDIDPFLFTVGQAVIRGGTISLREANAEIDEIGHVAKEWTLTAAHGRIAEDRFHFVLADGLEPPFASGVFDTVVTPWFIDLIPTDLRDFTSTVHRLLKPGGRWLNLGPLHYRPSLPVELRFSREEVFDLAERAGFRMGRWQTDSMPYLVSKLNGRGKVEWVLAFAATKLDASSSDRGSNDGPPSWLLFRHLPIPTFAGQSLFVAKAPLIQMVVSAIDGQRTLDDLALMVAAHARQSDLSMNAIRGAVRRCIAEIHPACRS